MKTRIKKNIKIAQLFLATGLMSGALLLKGGILYDISLDISEKCTLRPMIEMLVDRSNCDVARELEYFRSHKRVHLKDAIALLPLVENQMMILTNRTLREDEIPFLDNNYITTVILPTLSMLSHIKSLLRDVDLIDLSRQDIEIACSIIDKIFSQCTVEAFIQGSDEILDKLCRLEAKMEALICCGGCDENICKLLKQMQESLHCINDRIFCIADNIGLIVDGSVDIALEQVLEFHEKLCFIADRFSCISQIVCDKIEELGLLMEDLVDGIEQNNICIVRLLTLLDTKIEGIIGCLGYIKEKLAYILEQMLIGFDKNCQKIQVVEAKVDEGFRKTCAYIEYITQVVENLRIDSAHQTELLCSKIDTIESKIDECCCNGEPAPLETRFITRGLLNDIEEDTIHTTTVLGSFLDQLTEPVDLLDDTAINGEVLTVISWLKSIYSKLNTIN